MDDILSKLLESELLGEDAKVEITEAFGSAVEQMRSDIKEEVELNVRSELVEEWTTQRDALVDAVDEKVTDMMTEEFAELQEDIARFRDLEVEYAEKIVLEKHNMADQLSEELDSLVDKIDSFLEYRITDEMNELKEDLDSVRENEFGRTIFEAFTNEFNKSFVDTDSVFAKLSIAEQELEDIKTHMSVMENEKLSAKRKNVFNDILSPLSGVKREQMAMILQNVETDKLQEAYNMFIGKILREEDSSSKSKPLSESKNHNTVFATGDDAKAPAKRKKLKESTALKRTLKLAGI